MSELSTFVAIFGAVYIVQVIYILRLTHQRNEVLKYAENCHHAIEALAEGKARISRAADGRIRVVDSK